ncbi:MAG: PD-(D/E)XK nuclease superfamily protein [Bacilli bacterium]
MNRIVQGGSTANLNGRIFEETLIPIFENHGYTVFKNRDLKKRQGLEQYEMLDKKVLLSAPFVSIYGHTGKTEFLITNRHLNREIRVECKWQQSAGSVDEKFPYMLLNCIYAFRENDIILIVDGDGYKPSARAWLRNKINERWLLEDQPNKEIQLMTLSEFITYFNVHLR